MGKNQLADLAVRKLGSVTIMELLDRRLIDTARIEALGEQMMDTVKAAPGIKLIVNFEKVEYLSSTMLNVLIAVHNTVHQQKGQMVLANLPPELLKVLTLMKLQKKFTICGTVDDAMSVFAK
jgi:anti-anti-sigma factor